MKYDIWLDDLNQLKRFLVDVLGIDEAGRTFKEMIADSPGRQCLATIEHKPFTNKAGEPDIAANITRVARL
jgi:extradiol dioxygenase family protein